MSYEFLRDLSEEEATALLGLVIRRMPHHHGQIGSAVLEVLEMPLPEGADLAEFNRTLLADAFRLVGNSLEG